MIPDNVSVPAAVEWSAQRGLLYVRLSGAIDARVEPELRTMLLSTDGAFRRAIVDLDNVTFFGAVGLNFLAGLAGCGEIVQLIGLPERLPIRQQLAATGLDNAVLLPEAPLPALPRTEPVTEG